MRAEIAQSQSDDPLRAGSATAWLVEGKHASDRIDARAWARETEGEFGFGQQLTADTGTRSVGVDARYKLTETFSASGEAQHQLVLASEATRILASVDVRMQKQGWGLGVGVRHVGDEDASGDARVSDLAFLTGSVDVLDGRVTLRGEADAALGGKDDSVDYPARNLLGVDYHLSTDTTMFAEYEASTGEQLSADVTRFGMRTRPWERTMVNSSINSQATEYGPRTFANFGLTQGFRYKERWAFDVGVDQTNTLRGPDLEPLNPNAPLASGSMTDDFFAAFLGASYRQELWQMTSRLEHRNSDSEERWSSTTGWYREPLAGHAMSVSLQAFDSTVAQGGSTSAVGRFAWAFRPDSSAWIVFDRLELKYDDRTEVIASYDSARLVNNLHANWQLNPAMQLGVQYGVRYVASTFEGEKYAGISDIVGLDAPPPAHAPLRCRRACGSAAFVGIGRPRLLHGIRRGHHAREEHLGVGRIQLRGFQRPGFLGQPSHGAGPVPQDPHQGGSGYFQGFEPRQPASVALGCPRAPWERLFTGLYATTRRGIRSARTAGAHAAGFHAAAFAAGHGAAVWRWRSKTALRSWSRRAREPARHSPISCPRCFPEGACSSPRGRGRCRTSCSTKTCRWWPAPSACR